MYENLIQPQPLSKKQNNFSIRLAPMPVDEKAAYVASFCASLIDSRFGRRMTPFIINLSELPEDEEAVVLEMTVDGTVATYVILPGSEMARSYAADIVHRELAQTEVAKVSVAQTHLPSNLGRGSPKYRWDASRVGSPHVSKGLRPRHNYRFDKLPIRLLIFPA